MNDLSWIRCLGCNAIVAATRPACPGCGRCINCGRPRTGEIQHCPACSLPYCDCCGRCPECLDLRYGDVGPCDCGHPTDSAQLERLVRRHAVVGAEPSSTPIGRIVAVVVLLAVLIVGVVWMLR